MSTECTLEEFFNGLPTPSRCSWCCPFRQAIAEKIKTHAFSGGQETKALQEEKGADLEASLGRTRHRLFTHRTRDG